MRRYVYLLIIIISFLLINSLASELILQYVQERQLHISIQRYSHSYHKNISSLLNLFSFNFYIQTRQKILISAFTRSLKDPFPPARIAGITSLAITHTYYTSFDIAQRVLPILCTVTVDNDKAVRDQVRDRYCYIVQQLICTVSLLRLLKYSWKSQRNTRKQ